MRPLKNRARRCVLLAASAVAVLLAVTPQVALAEPTAHDISQGSVTISEEPGGCPGHVISGASDLDNHQVIVESGRHTITLDSNTRIRTTEDSPFVIEPGATVSLTIKGNVFLTSEITDPELAAPALSVETGATLTIGGSGKLQAKSESAGAAGIGGGPGSGCGTINITSGMVVAYGGDGAAGIGGGAATAAGGSQGGTISILGGVVSAFGGDYHNAAAPAIGAGAGASFSTGSVVISGGLVNAGGGGNGLPSIGGGVAGGKHGSFATDQDGDAVIGVSDGIGDMSDVADWNCILFTYADGLVYDKYEIFNLPLREGKDSVVIDGGTARVFGDVVATYSITLTEDTSLCVGALDTSGASPASLTMAAGTKLSNGGGASAPGGAGIVLAPGSALALPEGTSQCSGSGVMIAAPAEGSGQELGRVQLPLSSDMLSVSPTSFTYDGTAKQPEVSVAFTKWDFVQEFEQGTDFTVAYANNTELGEATATATAVSSAESDLLGGSGMATFEIVAEQEKPDEGQTKPPVGPETEDENTTDKPAGDDIPATGDDSNHVLPLVACVAGVAVLLCAVKLRSSR